MTYDVIYDVTCDAADNMTSDVTVDTLCLSVMTSYADSSLLSYIHCNDLFFIREIDAQDNDQVEQYETSADYSQMAPQVDEPTYIYEHQPVTVVPSQPQSSAHLLKRNESIDRDRSGGQVVTSSPSQQTTVYVEQTSEGTEGLRYSTAPIRYEDENNYHTRYEYHHGPHTAAHSEEIKVEINRNHHQGQAPEMHIYDHTEVHRQESQQVCEAVL